jgi:hypothetical protein
MKMAIEIRPMTAASACFAAELEKICFASPWSENALLQMAEDPNGSFLCAFSDGAVTVATHPRAR